MTERIPTEKEARYMDRLLRRVDYFPDRLIELEMERLGWLGAVGLPIVPGVTLSGRAALQRWKVTP